MTDLDLNGDDAGGATLVMNADGSWDFQANGMYDGLNTGDPDVDLTFTYTVDDGSGAEDSSTTADLLICVQGEGR